MSVTERALVVSIGSVVFLAGGVLGVSFGLVLAGVGFVLLSYGVSHALP